MIVSFARNGVGRRAKRSDLLGPDDRGEKQFRTEEAWSPTESEDETRSEKAALELQTA